MKRFARTRSDSLASQPPLGRAQCSVGSIEDDGIRYGFTTQALIASTIAIAPAIVTIQSIAIRQGLGSRVVIRLMGLRECRAGCCCIGMGAGSGLIGGSSEPYPGGRTANGSPSPL